jgi:8-oxo-dGTP pyrophosphatase MutT (NUDIX family)
MSDSFDDSAVPSPPPDPVSRPPFDPERAPVLSHASGRAIDAATFAATDLRAYFANPRSWQPERTDEARKPRLRRNATGLVPASVLVPIVLRADGATMLLTERTAHLNDHAGQVSFPGGSAEAQDVDVVATALRETEEEIGLSRAHVEVVGRLPDYPTVTGFNVAPIVALVHPPFTLTPDPFEVAEAFEVPLAFLLDPANHQRREVTIDGLRRRFVAMPYGPHFIWGATAAMLRNLYLFIAAQTER